MSLRDLPLPKTELSKAPHINWLKYARSYEDCIRLESWLRGIPVPWIEWAERVAKSRERRYPNIENPLKYRMAILSNGITSLQESKYLCDIIENSLRQSIHIYCLDQNVSWSKLRCASHHGIEKKLEKAGVCIMHESPISMEIIMHSDFHHILDMITTNWNKFQKTRPAKVGFSKLFWPQRQCRDVERFKSEMKKVRDLRNRMAHSRELLLPHELQNIYKISQRWLSALGINVNDKIVTYRRKRPRFLETLTF